MKKLLLTAVLLIAVSICFGFKQEDVQTLLNTNACEKCDLIGADLRDLDLDGAQLLGAFLQGAMLSRTDLTNADLSNASLQETDLREADLSGANLTNANMRYANVQATNFDRATLRSAMLEGLDFNQSQPHVEGAIVDNARALCKDDWKYLKDNGAICKSPQRLDCRFGSFNTGEQKKKRVHHDEL